MTNLLSHSEKIILGSILGFISPMFLMLVFWWSSLPFIKESSIKWFALLGFFTGLAVDFLFLKQLISRVYKFNKATLIFIYIFYMIGLYGFFMGVPLFNILPGIMAGVYLGRRLNKENKSRKSFNNSIFKLTYFTSLVLIVFMSTSAYLALTDKSTAANLEGMFMLPFQVTNQHIIGIIIIGGLGLLGVQVFLTRIFAKFFFKYKDSN